MVHPAGLVHQVLLEPARQVIQPLDAAVGAAVAGEPVEFLGEAYEFGIDAKTFERHKHLFALFDRAAQIHLIVHHQGGRPGITDVGDGGTIPVILQILKGSLVIQFLLEPS